MLLSHISGLGDGFLRLPWLSPRCAVAEGSADPCWRSTLNPRPRSDRGGSDDKSGLFSGGILLMQVAMTDELGEDFGSFMQQESLQPLGMRHSGFDQPRIGGDGQWRAGPGVDR